MSISDRDLETLSAYLDGELSGKTLARLEERLQTNKDLQIAHEQLQRTRMVVRSLPKLRALRNYTLTPEMVGITQKPSRAFPVLRLASVLATLLLILVFMGDIFVLPNLALPTSEALQFAESAVEEPVQPVMEAEIIESELPAAAPVEEEMDKAMLEAEAPPAAAEAIIIPEEESAPLEDSQILSTLSSPAEGLADELGGETELLEEPLSNIKTRAIEPQFASEDQAGFDLGAVIRFTEIALIIIALSTSLTAIYLYRKYR